MASNTSPLEGQALLDQYAALSAQGFTHKQIAIESGYYSLNEKDGPRQGQVRARVSALNEAMLRAQGVNTGPAGPQTTGKSRSVIKTTGTASVSSALVQELGLSKGDFINWEVLEGQLVGTPAPSGRRVDVVPDYAPPAPAALAV